MERLLEDAERIKASQGELADYSIDSFADIVEAIHVVQENLGITGTTAEEASGTIQGSLSALKAAWENLIIGFADENADLDQLIDNVVQTGITAVENLIPVIGQALRGIGQFVREIAPVIEAELPGLLDEIVPPILDGMAYLLGVVIDALPGIAAELMTAVAETIAEHVPALQPLMDVIIDLVGWFQGLDEDTQKLITTLLLFSPAISPVIDIFLGLGGGVGNLVKAFGGLAGKAIPELATAFGGLSAVTALEVGAIGVGVAEIINGTKQLIEAHKAYEAAFEAHNNEIETAFDSYEKLYKEKGKEVADEWAEMVYQIDTTGMSMDEAQKALAERIDGYWDGVPQSMWEGFKAGWDDYFGADGRGLLALLGDAFTGAVNGVRDVLGIHSPSTVFEDIGTNIVFGLQNGIGKNGPAVENDIYNLVSNIVNMANDGSRDMEIVGENLLWGLSNGINNALGGVINSAVSAARSIYNAVTGFFGIASPSKLFMGVGDYLMQGLSEGILDGLSSVEDAMDEVEDAVMLDDGGYDDEIVTTTTTEEAPEKLPGLIPTDNGEDRDIVVILELDGDQFGRAVYRYNQRETQRKGVQLAGGYS